MTTFYPEFNNKEYMDTIVAECIASYHKATTTTYKAVLFQSMVNCLQSATVPYVSADLLDGFLLDMWYGGSNLDRIRVIKAWSCFADQYAPSVLVQEYMQQDGGNRSFLLSSYAERFLATYNSGQRFEQSVKESIS